MKPIVVGLLAVALLSACAPEQPTEIQVRLTTDNVTIGVSNENKNCVWVETSYVLKNGEGDTIATGKLPDGSATAGGHDGIKGEVTSSAPDYECILDFTIAAEPAEFYELEVTTFSPIDDETYTETVDFSSSDTVVVEFG